MELLALAIAYLPTRKLMNLINVITVVTLSPIIKLLTAHRVQSFGL